MHGFFSTVSNNKEERKQLWFYYVNPHFPMLAKSTSESPNGKNDIRKTRMAEG